VYGYQVQEGRDELIALVEQASREFSETVMPGKYMVDVFPWREFSMFTIVSHFFFACADSRDTQVNYLPSWFPGTSWKAEGVRLRRSMLYARDKPFNFVEDELVGPFLSSHVCRDLLTTILG
jgi:hypothetical protein